MDFEKLTVKKTSEMFREGFKVGRDQISRYKFDLLFAQVLRVAVIRSFE